MEPLPLKNVRYEVAGFDILLSVPKNPESCLNATVEGKGLDPFWGQVWDAAAKSAKMLIIRDWNSCLETLELGCGCGLLGVVAGRLGMKVIFSDHDPNAIALSTNNARINGNLSFDGLVLDWAKPKKKQFERIIASDILYEQSSHLGIINLLDRMLADSGIAGIGDPGRRVAVGFVSELRQAGYSVSCFNELGERVTSNQVNQFQWLEIRRNKP